MKIIDLVTKISCLFFLILVNQAIFGQQYTINTVPNPKKLNNTWVSDPDNNLSADTKNLLNDKINALKRNNSAEIAIVVLNSIGKVNPADFAVDLFNLWKIGLARENNGLLILLVMDQRRVEFKTGYGLEEILTDKECVDIQQQFMVPEFKRGDYNRGIVAGLDAAAVELLGEEKWQRTALPDELKIMEQLSSKSGRKLSKVQRVFDVDTLLSDSILSVSEEIIKMLADSFAVTSYFYAFRSLNGISPQKMSAFLDEKYQYSKNNKNLIIWVFEGKSNAVDLFYIFKDSSNVYNNNALLDYYKEELGNSKGNGFRYNFQLALTEMLQTVLSDSIRTLKINTQVQRDSIRKAQAAVNIEPKAEVKKHRFISRFWIDAIALYMVCLTIFVLISLAFMLATVFIKDPYRKYKLLVFFSFDIWAYIFPLPFVLLKLWIDNLKQRFRNAPRHDPKTGKELFKLSDIVEDKFLKAGQLTEEMINSIHYDVWASFDKKEILVLSYPIYFTKYSRCASCATKAYYMVFNRTISAATTYSSGLGEKKYECKHCKRVHQYTYVIPKIQNSSSSSSSGGSSGGGGSFGGGSSGGGGGGSSW
jgi:uncharacterized membrane protein YgcG